MKIINKLPEINNYSFLIRFINLPKLLDIVIHEYIPFTRLDYFEDKSEAISNQQLIKHLYPSLWSVDPPKKELQLQTRQKRYFATCWFGSERESFAMWNLYSDSNSVALKYSVNDFIDLWKKDNLKFSISEDWIDRFYLGEIKYINYLGKDIFKKEKEVFGLYKDESYKSEQEVRVLIKCKGILNKGEKTEKKFSDLELNNLSVKPRNLKKIPFTVLFHPEMRNSHKEDIKKLLEDYGFNNAKYEDSELAKLLKFESV